MDNEVWLRRPEQKLNDVVRGKWEVTIAGAVCVTLACLAWVSQCAWFAAARPWVTLIIGFAFSGFAASFLVGRLVTACWLRAADVAATRDQFKAELQSIRKKDPFFVHLWGIIERAIYTGAVLAAAWEVAAAWLLLKVAAQWSAWKAQDGNELKTGTTADDEDRAWAAMYASRNRWATFVGGSGLSLLYGVAGGLVARSTDFAGAASAALASIALVVGTVVAKNIALCNMTHRRDILA